MNEGLICQKLTQALHCGKAFYDAGLCGKITNSEGLKKLLKKKISLPCPLFRFTIKLPMILKK